MVRKTGAETEKRQRIVALDLLRGYLLIVIMIDHFGWFPSPFEFLSGRGSLWASAAEGFFLISGLLVGYIYTPRILKSFRMTALKLWRRGLLLYAWAVALTIVFTWWGQHIGAGHTPAGLWENPPPGEFLFKALTLQYVYGWADFLQYYAVYMMIAPFALWLCVRRFGWLVLLVSASVCFAGQGYLLSWQLLFMIGVVGGYYLPALQQWYHKLPRRRSKQVAGAFGVLAAATITFSALTDRLAAYAVESYGGFSALPNWLHDGLQSLFNIHIALLPWTQKDNLGLLRLASALVWFVALYLLFRRYERQIDRLSRGVLRAFGENSLVVYIVQSVLVFAALAYIGQDWRVMLNTGLTLAGLAAAYGAVRLWRLLAPRLQQRTAGAAFAAVIILAAAIGAWQAAWYPAVMASPPVEAAAVVPRPLARAGSVLHNITYCDGQTLDIYRPRTMSHHQAPVVLYLHGGGWTMNDKASEPDQLAMIDGLRDKGYAVVSANYRQLPEKGYPAAVEDSLCAVRFLRAHADKYDLDRSKIAVYGFSAGGYLAAMVGSLPDNSSFETVAYAQFSSRVGAVVTLAGIFDFTDGLTPGNYERIDAFLQGADPVVAEAATYVSPDDPPYLLVHGTDDQYVPLEQDDLMAGLLEGQQVPHERLVVEHADHGLNPVDGELSPSRQSVKQTMDDFIQRQLGE